MKKKFLVFALLCFLPIAAQAGILISTPEIGKLDGVVIFDPGGTYWRISLDPFIDCDDPGANCVDIQCSGIGPSCTAADRDACYVYETLTIGTGEPVLFHWKEVDPSNCPIE